MDATELGLLRAICENPAEDDPRLRYADWLDENGQPERAEFIRVQVRLAGPFRGCDPVCNQETGHGRHCEHDLRDELRRRERDLWPGAVFHMLDVLRPTKAIPDEMVVHLLSDRPTDRVPRKPEAYTSRGFVSHVTCTAKDWLTHADAIAASQPIERVTLTTVPGIVTCRGGLYARLSGRWKELAWGVGRNGVQLVEDLLAAEWPRIKFTLPPSAVGVNVATVAGVIAAGAFAIMDPDGTVTATP